MRWLESVNAFIFGRARLRSGIPVALRDERWSSFPREIRRSASRRARCRSRSRWRRSGRSARPLIGESSPSVWPVREGRRAVFVQLSLHCPGIPGPRVVVESVPGAGGQKEAASPPSRRERRIPTADLQRQLGFPRTAQPAQNLHAYYVLARGQDLTEEGQFFPHAGRAAQRAPAGGYSPVP
jgi:hypothetical protein